MSYFFNENVLPLPLILGLFHYLGIVLWLPYVTHKIDTRDAYSSRNVHTDSRLYSASLWEDGHKRSIIFNVEPL